MASCGMATARYAVPDDAIRLEADDERVHLLAEKLWFRSPEDADPAPLDAPERGGTGGARSLPGPILLDVRVVDAAALSATRRETPATAADAERRLRWTHREEEYVAVVPGLVLLRVDLANARAEARVSRALVEKAPAFVARLLLESPVAVLLARRGFTVLHAGAVVGPGGAVVVRGGAGAGKSTLVAAAWRAGFGVLADESLLVGRDDADRLASSVRDLTLLPDATRLLGLDDATEEAFTGGEEKRRVDLFRLSTPERRAAARVATLLLGPRRPGPARLVPLGHEEFRAAFRDGEIPQERRGGDPDSVARAWASRASWRLDGAEDLAGAVEILGRLAA